MPRRATRPPPLLAEFDDEEREAVLSANRAFYRAFTERNAVAMDQIWASTGAVVCLHPGRAPLHARWWVNDPDCLLVRAGTRLTLDEIHFIATAIALTGGSLLLSDDLTHLDDDRLELARSLTPVIGKPARVLDWFDTPNPHRLRVDLSGPAGAWSRCV